LCFLLEAMRLIAVLLASLVIPQAQGQPAKPFVGTVAGFRPEKAEIEIKTDSGDLVVGRITGDTISQQIAPGERDLKKATSIKAVDLSIGDRVLVTLETGTSDIRRIVVMSVTDIARRDEADRADWQKRGVAGIVSAKSGKQVIVKNTTMGGSAETAITVSDQTTFKRYSPDSVRFSDAKTSGPTVACREKDLPAREIGKEMTMDARLDYLGSPLTMKVVKHINSARAVLHDSGLPAATQGLVEIRASQINGCGFCVDMHTKDAAHAGESQQRLNLIAAWREATVFTEAERAALELTEQGTRIADAAGGVTDEAWANAAKHYDDDQLAALVSLIALINAYNRVNVIIRQPAGDYQPGQFV